MRKTKAKAGKLREWDVADYVRHAQQFGPECVMDTAVQQGDLSDKDLGALKAFIESRERTHKWEKGQWVEVKAKAARVCLGCGLDLPPGSNTRKRYHGDSCRMKAVRLRAAGHTIPPAVGSTVTGLRLGGRRGGRKAGS